QSVHCLWDGSGGCPTVCEKAGYPSPILCAPHVAHQRRIALMRHATTQALGSPSRLSSSIFPADTTPASLSTSTPFSESALIWIYWCRGNIESPPTGSLPDDGSRKWSCRQLPAGFSEPRLHDAVPPFSRVAYPHEPRYDLA